ncbi:MAG: MFS transporter [Burkholderiales bacterium]|nr:MFS transporter [Burkholderiales bacterium]
MSTPDGPGHPGASDARAHPYWRANLRVIPVANFLGALGFSVSFPFLPLMVRNLGLHEGLETRVGWMVFGFYMTGFFVTPIWGGIADHYGRKIMVLRATLGMGVCMSLVAFAPDPGWFAALFVAIGLFNGFVPAGMALLVANTPPARIGRALSTAQTGAVFGHTVGPAAGAGLAVLIGESQWLFSASGALMLAAGILVLFFVHEVKQLAPGRWRPEWIGSLRQLVRLPRMAPLYLLSLVFAMLWHGSIPVITIHMLNLNAAHPSGPDAWWVGAAALGLGVASIVSLPLWGRVIDRVGPARVLAASVAGAAVTHLPLLAVDTPAGLVGSRVAFGLAAVAMQPAILQLIRVHAPAGMDARAIAYASSFQFLAMALAPFVAGYIGPVFGLKAYFALNIALTVAALVLWVRAAR